MSEDKGKERGKNDKIICDKNADTHSVSTHAHKVPISDLIKERDTINNSVQGA